MLTVFSVLLLFVWPLVSSVAGEISQTGEARTGGPSGQATTDTTAAGEMFLVVDSLAAQYAGGEEQPSEARPAGRGLSGQVSYERTLVPLHHAGGNAYQSILDAPSLLDTIRRLKRNPEWHPFRPGRSGTRPYDSHYDRDGATTASHVVRGSIERALTPSRQVAALLAARYTDVWGPFPNQHTTRLDGLFRFTTRLSPTETATMRFLGADQGWYLHRGNTVYTDRARYALEDLNRWRARTGGVELALNGQPAAAFSYAMHIRLLSTRWASDPPDAPAPLPATVPAEPSFLYGVFPVAMTPRFAATRFDRTLSAGAEMAFQANAVHRVITGVEIRLHRLGHTQRWVPSPDPRDADGFDLGINPRDYSVAVDDRLRFGALVMAIGVRYDVYRPGGATWRDVYRTLGDDRAAQSAVRRLLLTAGGDSHGTRLVSPHLVASYPFRRWTVHVAFSVSSRSPSFEQLYAGTDLQTSAYTDRTITDLRPQRLTTLEGGIGKSLGASTLDLTTFYRDSERFLAVFGPEVLPQTLSNYPGYWGRVNAGFQGQGGLEATIIRRSTPVGASKVRLSGRLSYLLLFTLRPLHDTDRPLQPGHPLTPGDLTTFGRRLNDFWNRRHWAAIAANLRLPSGLAVTATGHLQSGARYRAPDLGQPGRRILPDQSARTGTGPWLRRLDARVDIPLPWMRSLSAATLFVEARNLTNTEIVHEIPDPRWFEATGQPDNPLLNQVQWAYGPARAIWSGIGLRW